MKLKVKYLCTGLVFETGLLFASQIKMSINNELILAQCQMLFILTAMCVCSKEAVASLPSDIL